MLPSVATYEQLRENFHWKIPADYNMGVDVCEKWAKRDPERTAIIDLTGDERRDFSFADLKAMSDQIAVYLRKQGIERGDRVGIYRAQSVWTAVAHIAVWKLGAISIPLFKLFGEEALKSRLIDSGTVMVITDAEGAETLYDMHGELPGLKSVMVADGFSGPELADFQPVETGPDDPAVIIYTSGTTGPPKGALHGHRILPGHLPGVEMSHDMLPMEGDCLWTPADWAWIGGLFDVLMPGLHHGIPVVAARLATVRAGKCQRIIETTGVRNFFCTSTALKFL